MPNSRPTFENIDHYIASASPEVRAILEKIRTTIRKAVPEATETISYKIPGFKLNGNILVYFAAFKKHIGLYPPVKGYPILKKAVARYAGPKGNLQFPLDQPIPYELIKRIAKSRASRLLAKRSR